MTDPDPTDPERALIQWLSDTIGLSKAHEAELARRLGAMRAALTTTLAVKTRVIDEIHRATGVTPDGLADILGWIDEAKAALRAAQPAPAPSEAEARKAWHAQISALRAADLRQDWPASRQAQDGLDGIFEDLMRRAAAAGNKDAL